MDISWDDAKLFLAVAEAGSVSAAARHLRVAQPTVTRRLRELEEAIGTPLFERGTSGVTLTARGERLLEPARQMSTWAAELSRAADDTGGAPAGVVRVTAPPGVAASVVAPFARWLKTRLPGIRLEVLSSVDYLDLARGQADLAIRMRPTPRGSAQDEARRDLVVVHSVDVPIAAWGSADYVASLPTSPSLADIAWIAWAPPYEHLAPSSVLKAVIPNFTPAFAADDFLVQLAAAEAGVGAVILGDFGDAGHPVVSHRLQKLPLDLSGYGTSTVSLVAAKSAMGIGRIRAVADALVELMQGAAPSRRRSR